MSKIENLRESVRKLREKTAPTIKTTAMSVVGGAAAKVVFDVVADRVQQLQQAWWMEPAALALGGHLLRRKNHDLGVGMLGAAGYALAVNSRVSSMARAASAGIAPISDARGYVDAGALSQDAIQAAISQGIGQGLARMLPTNDAGAYVSDAGAYVSDAGAI